MASDGRDAPWPAHEKIHAAGADGAITSLKADATRVYGSGYAFGSARPANFEGTFALDPMTGPDRLGQDDCLGDTYDVAPVRSCSTRSATTTTAPPSTVR